MLQQYILLLQLTVYRENQGDVAFCEQPPRQSAYRILIILYSSFESTSLPRSLLGGCGSLFVSKSTFKGEMLSVNFLICWKKNNLVLHRLEVLLQMEKNVPGERGGVGMDNERFAVTVC